MCGYIYGCVLPPCPGKTLATSTGTTFYQSVEALQADFDRWLVEYNTQRPHQGYRNMGKRPIETVLQYLESVRQEG